ncbi:MAG: PaaX family transcriptional regulator C-terminal domain-containing protein [Microthrixaceae bacterium]
MSGTERPLTARSVLASTLLGTDPPRLPVAFLVRTGALFGLSEGAVRTALSRMATAGEARADGEGWYSLDGDLVARQLRQRQGRAARTSEHWSGRWAMGVVGAGARVASERAGLRAAMQRLRLAELREGVWLRPDNLDPGRQPTASAVVDAQCRWFVVEPGGSLDAPEDQLVAQLWDLEDWSARAVELRRRMHELSPRLDSGDSTALAPGFVLSAAVLRHFGADPLLPRELLPRRWAGDALRVDYDGYDLAYRELLARWAGEAHGAAAATAGGTRATTTIEP